MKPRVETGNSPVLLAQPHGGTEIPESILKRLNSEGHVRADTDWHIGRLYEGLLSDATIVSTALHRYVIDANRDPQDEPLYPGQNTTSLCPTTTFDGSDIYLTGQAPSADEIQQRQLLYHQPYHDVLAEQLERIHQLHGYVILYDCHSIRSLIPFLFEGKLADFNIGTNSGSSCDLSIESTVKSLCNCATEFDTVTNGRFKGGWTTRHYGQPQRGYHTIQMELAQCNYMLEQAPWHYDSDRAARLRVILADILTNLATVLG